MKKLKGLSAEMVVALGATFVSLCALTVSIIETNIMYEQSSIMYEQRIEERTYQRASVWPNLAFMPSRDNNLHSISLVNNGVGPAIIKSFNISVDGTVFGSWEQAIISMYGSTNVLKQSYGIVDGSVYPAGKSTVLMTVNSKDFFSHASELKVSVCYCSVYEDCWIQNGLGIGSKVEQCSKVSNTGQ